MCSFFGIQMDNYQGDLTDILRAGGGAVGCGSASDASSDVHVQAPNWQFPFDPVNFSSSIPEDHRVDTFGDPFSSMRDPLLHELNMAGSGYFGSSNSAELMSTSAEESNSFGDVNILGPKSFEEDMKGPCNIFSRIQISPSPPKLPLSPCDSTVVAAAGASPRGIKAPAVLPGDMINANSSKSCLMDNNGPIQISAPRNLGIKRRLGKSQAKKVVCIPAPAAVNSRSSGEVVPSDLWAWRKYGQKPIKGSPYPRGYYRCSSSKGCSARKQVERSRTDPNMLVITYTSEHNHPWPTQRNALAGSTRCQAAKTNAAASSKSSPTSKEEAKESSNDTLSPAVAASSTASASVKEEMEDMDRQFDMDDAEFSEGLSQTYRPALPESDQADDFFADLDEIEADPLDLIFSQGFREDERKEGKALDPFNLFDWSGDNSTSTSSFRETKRGL